MSLAVKSGECGQILRCQPPLCEFGLKANIYGLFRIWRMPAGSWNGDVGPPVLLQWNSPPIIDRKLNPERYLRRLPHLACST